MKYKKKMLKKENRGYTDEEDEREFENVVGYK